MRWNRECRILMTLARQLGYNTVSEFARFIKQTEQNNTIIGLRNAA